MKRREALVMYAALLMACLTAVWCIQPVALAGTPLPSKATSDRPAPSSSPRYGNNNGAYPAVGNAQPGLGYGRPGLGYGQPGLGYGRPGLGYGQTASGALGGTRQSTKINLNLHVPQTTLAPPHRPDDPGGVGDALDGPPMDPQWTPDGPHTDPQRTPDNTNAARVARGASLMFRPAALPPDVLFDGEHRTLVAIMPSTSESRLQYRNLGVVLAPSRATSLSATRDEVWAILPAGNNTYHIRSSARDGRYLAASDSCAEVVTSAEPFAWGVSLRRNGSLVAVAPCEPPRYLATTGGVDGGQAGDVALRPEPYAWRAKGVIGKKRA